MAEAAAAARPPDWRVGLQWRFLGFVLLTVVALVLVDEPSPGASLLGSALAGLALLAVGGRTPVLALTSFAVGSLLVEIVAGRHPYQLAEEYLPLCALPLAGLVLTLWARHRPGAGDPLAERDDAQLALFRSTLVLMMFFAAFHKFNGDFLDPTVSCATVHASRLLELLQAGPLLHSAVPWLAVLGEASVPLLLVFAPRIGLPFSVGLMAYVGHRGATPFTLLVMMLACAYLRSEDGDRIAAGYRRFTWPVLGLHGVALAACVAFLPGLAGWARYGLWVLALLNLGIALAFALAPDLVDLLTALRRRSWSEFVPRRSHLLPRERGARLFLVALMTVGALNAFSPYLGLKLRLSFAMFSNLRVDEARWNSRFVPRVAFMRAHDAYVHVISSSGSAAAQVPPGLYSPRRLADRLIAAGRQGGRVDLELRYEGEERRSEHAARDAALREWLGQLPGSIWFHAYLPAQGPQSCLH